jgi:hypothetical protein
MNPKPNFFQTLRLNLLWSPFFVGTVCVLLLGVDIIPGKVSSLFLELPGWILIAIAIVVIFMILLTIAWLVWSVIQLIRRRVKLSTKRFYEPLISLLMVILTCVALSLHVPTKLAFLVSYPQFQRAIVPAAVESGSRVGLFRIESVTYPSKNLKDGVHFQLLSTWSGATSTYGISYRPNLQNERMPYGFISKQGYDRIWGNWYIFQATEC